MEPELGPLFVDKPQVHLLWIVAFIARCGSDRPRGLRSWSAATSRASWVWPGSSWFRA